MLDTPFIHISLILTIIFLVYKLKQGSYEVCKYIDKPLSHLITLCFILYLAESYLTIAIILLFGYVLIIDECYIRKWEKTFEKITIGNKCVQKCTITEIEPVYKIPQIDSKVGSKHLEPFVGKEYFLSNN